MFLFNLYEKKFCLQHLFFEQDWQRDGHVENRYLDFRKMLTIKPSNNQQFYEEGDDHKYWTLLIQGPKMEKRFNSAFKMFMRNQQRLTTSSTPKASALTSDQELGNISESERLSKRFNRALKVLLKSNNGFKNPEKCPCSLS